MSKHDNTYSALAKRFDLLKDEPLKRHTSFKVGGPADVFAQPENTARLQDLLKEAKKLKIPVTLFGGGTNLLISDKGIRGLVITTRKLKSDIRITTKKGDKTLVRANAGERLSKVCRFAMNHSLSGLEFASGIPGTVGGAAYMNAGTPMGNMADIIESVQILKLETLDMVTLSHKQLDFSYRQSSFKDILLSLTLTLENADPKHIKTIVNQTLNRKNKTQPMGVASAGCFFKNPAKGQPAGKLIEDAGLKGTRINDAQVSKIHANYIVNINNATCKDILLLKQKIQQVIMEKYHIKLETEVRVEGE